MIDLLGPYGGTPNTTSLYGKVDAENMIDTYTATSQISPAWRHPSQMPSRDPAAMAMENLAQIHAMGLNARVHPSTSIPTPFVTLPTSTTNARSVAVPTPSPTRSHTPSAFHSAFNFPPANGGPFSHSSPSARIPCPVLSRNGSPVKSAREPASSTPDSGSASGAHPSTLTAGGAPLLSSGTRLLKTPEASQDLSDAPHRSLGIEPASDAHTSTPSPSTPHPSTATEASANSVPNPLTAIEGSSISTPHPLISKEASAVSAPDPSTASEAAPNPLVGMPHPLTETEAAATPSTSVSHPPIPTEAPAESALAPTAHPSRTSNEAVNTGSISVARDKSVPPPSLPNSSVSLRGLRPRAAVHDNSPKWLSEMCVTYLKGVADSSLWTDTISDWVRFEHSFASSTSSVSCSFSIRVRFTSNHTVKQHRLPVKLRPRVLSTWLQGTKRRYDEIPTISENDLPAFADEWAIWWNSIQPAWRQSPSDSPAVLLPLSAAKGSETVDALKKAGPTGLVLVIISLAWWAPLRSTDPRWDSSVADVHACLKLFLEVGKGKKRGRKEGGPDKIAKKQKA